MYPNKKAIFSNFSLINLKLSWSLYNYCMKIRIITLLFVLIAIIGSVWVFFSVYKITSVIHWKDRDSTYIAVENRTITAQKDTIVSVITQLPGWNSYKGAGFFIDDHWGILTNSHVVPEEWTYTVILMDGKEIWAELESRHPTLDIALLRISLASPGAALSISEAILEQGQTVWTLGTIDGKYPNTYLHGVVSALGRSWSIDGRQYDNLIQTDIPLTSGNSGSPLFDTTGKVVGINVAFEWGDTHIGWAIPITEKFLHSW